MGLCGVLVDQAGADRTAGDLGDQAGGAAGGQLGQLGVERFLEAQAGLGAQLVARSAAPD